MSFIINQNFDLKSPQFNFARDYFADVASLKAASENDFPDHFITNVAGTLYQLTKSNSTDTTTGKWRKIKLGSDVNLSGYATKADLNNKVDKVSGKGLSTNDFTAAYKIKLDGITAGANKYSLPTATEDALGGVMAKSIGTPISFDTKTQDTVISGFHSTTAESDRLYPVELFHNGRAFVNVPWTDSNTTYGVATTSNNGLMSSTDKTKLDGIAEGANKISVDNKVTESSTNPVSSAALYLALNSKVDKVAGKALSTNDFTTAYKNKLDGIAINANKTIVDTEFNAASNNAIANSTVAGFNNKVKEQINTINKNFSSLQTSVDNITAIPDTEIKKLFNN